MIFDQYDKWEHTEAALRAMRKLFDRLHATQPAKGSPEEKLWMAEMTEACRWAKEIGDRRHAINITALRKWRVDNGRTNS